MDCIVGALKQAILTIGDKLVTSLRWKVFAFRQRGKKAFGDHNASGDIVLQLNLGGGGKVLSKLVHPPSPEWVQAHS